MEQDLYVFDKLVAYLINCIDKSSLFFKVEDKKIKCLKEKLDSYAEYKILLLDDYAFNSYEKRLETMILMKKTIRDILYLVEVNFTIDERGTLSYPKIIMDPIDFLSFFHALRSIFYAITKVEVINKF